MMADAYRLLSEARAMLDEHEHLAAASLLEKAKALEPGRGSIVEALGIAYYNSGRHELAMREFEEALEIDPTNHFARYGLSRCLSSAGRLEHAIGQVKLAMAMAPEVELYSSALARYQRELGRRARDREEERGTEWRP